MRYFLGVDGGGTKTNCCLANEKGQVLGRGQGGSSLYYVGGLRKAIQAVKGAIDQALASYGGQVDVIETACFGLAGIDSSRDHDTLYQALSGRGFAKSIVLENDAVIALIGSSAEAYGVVLIAGTGAIAFGIDRLGRRRRAGGWGHVIGDEGSGYDIAISGVRAALKAYDGRGRDTVLIQLLKERLALRKMDDIMERVYFSLSRQEIAALSHLVFEAASQGDQVAIGIIQKAGHELAQNIIAVLTGLELLDQPIEVPLVGGVFKNEHRRLLIEVIKSAVLASAPQAKVAESQFDPVKGALILALSHAGVEMTPEILTNLQATKDAATEIW